MSNVLIGIIGVILFIGLALAGALFLGPRFQSANNNAAAAAAVQKLSQVSAAYSQYVLMEGTEYPWTGGITAPGDEIYTKGYLKAQVSGPTGVQAIITNAAGSGNRTATSAANVPYAVIMLLGTDGAAKGTCEAIQRQEGNIGATDPFDSTSRTAAAPLPFRAGCYNASGTYVAYQQL